MSAAENGQEQVDLVEHPSKAPPAPNPFAQSANVLISVPESVEVRLVDASVLADYEVWFFVTSILASAFVGFLVSYLQTAEGTRSQLSTTVLFGVLMFIAGGMALAKRARMHGKLKKIRFRVGEELHDKAV